MSPPDVAALVTAAYLFAQDSIQHVLNNTITDGITIRAAVGTGGYVWVGHQISEDNFVGKPIPVGVGDAPPRCWLYVIHQFALNESGYLVDTKSSCELWLDGGDPILRYEYEREPDKPYPEAHLHVHGRAEGFDELFTRAGRFDHADLSLLHLPVGGRRFRPVLEDLIEFLIVERLAEPRTEAWPDVVAEHRAAWYEKQLSAAVKRDPSTAEKALDEWRAENPDESLG